MTRREPPLDGQFDRGWRLEHLDFSPQSHKRMTSFLHGREADVVETLDVDTTPLAFEPQGYCSTVEFQGDVRALGQGEDVRRFMRVRSLDDDGRTGEAWGLRAWIRPDAVTCSAVDW